MSLTDTLRELVEEARPLPATRARDLSGLSRSESRLIERVWPRIDASRRLELVNQLALLAEDNVELDFEAVLRCGAKDPETEVAVVSIHALWECEARWFLDLLLVALRQDERDAVREAAAIALGRFAMDGELGRLRSELAERVDGELVNAWQRPGEVEAVRRRVLEAMALRSSLDVQQAIAEAYREGSVAMKASALYAMGRGAASGWIGTLLHELESPEATLRYEALDACAELADPQAVPAVAKCLDDEDPQVRVQAVRALAAIGGDEARVRLEECVRSGDEVLRGVALEALEEMELEEDLESGFLTHGT